MEPHGYQYPFITYPLRGKYKVQAMEDHIEHQQEVLQLLKDNLTISQNRTKKQVDRHCNERNFEV